VLVAAVIPFLLLALLVQQRSVLHAAPADQKADPAAPAGGTLAFIGLPGVWMCFAYFFLTAIALAGIQGFAASSLMSLYNMSLAWATTGYSAYMLASAGGMVAGGFLAARAKAHDRTIAASFTLAALLALVLAAAVVPAALAVVLMGAIGLAAGIAGPSRDLLIRAAAPKNATGRVYGVVYSGLDSGLAVGPLVFGALMDAHQPAWVFVGVALFQALAIGTALGVGGSARRPLLQSA
jgi:FSR family fosmidomycin resistance protein-like MFS transporter